MQPFVAALLALGLANPAAAAPGSQSALAPGLAPGAVVSEASLEGYINLAGELAQGDNTAKLKALKAQLDALLLEKKALITKIAALEKQVAAAQSAGDSGKLPALRNEIEDLQAGIAKVDDAIQRILKQMQQLAIDEERRQKEAAKAGEALRKFTVAALEVAPRDAFVKTLSPAARDAALAKARRGIEALTGVAQAAGLTAANAASAAASGANSQRMLVRPPTPTPAPSVIKKSLSTTKH